MAEKRYGVKISLLEELRQFQLSLLNQRKNKPFKFSGFPNVSFNQINFLRYPIRASCRTLEIDIMNITITHHLPKNTDLEVYYNYVTVPTEKFGRYVTLTFDNWKDQELFVRALGFFNKSSSDDDSVCSDIGTYVTIRGLKMD